MRKRMGGLLLAAGVGALGVWGNFNQARVMEQSIADNVSAIAATAPKSIEAFVEGRDIRVTGVVNDEAERQSVLAAMDAVQGRRVVVDDLTIIPIASPFTFEHIKTSNGSDYTGFVPSEIVRAELVPTLGRGAADLVLSSGAPEAWVDAIVTGNAGLDQLKEGTLSISDMSMTLTGLAATPVEKEAALAAIILPEGFTLTSDIDVEDDGKPFSLKVVFDGSKTKITGKVPAGTDIATVASGRGLRAVDTDVEVARIDDIDEYWVEFAQTGLAALGRLLEGTMEIEGRNMTMTGVGTPSGKTDAESLLGPLQSFILNVTSDIRIYDDGQPIVVRATKEYREGIVASDGKLPVDYNISDARITDPEVLRTGFLPDTTGNFDGNLRAASGALMQLREGTLEASGDAVRITGVAGSIAALNNVTALLEERVRGQLEIEVTVYDDGKEFALIAAKKPDGNIAATSGKLPFGVTEASFGLPPATTVAQASIEDDTGTFNSNVKAGLAALEALNFGTMDVTVDRVKVTGTVDTPAQEAQVIAALNQLPDTMNRQADLTVLDDGTPPAYEIDFDPSKGVTIEGKLPAGFSSADIGALLGVPVARTTARTGLIGDPVLDEVVIAKFATWLPELEFGTLSIDGDDVMIDGVVSPGADRRLIESALKDSMGRAVQVRLSEMDVLPLRGTRRTNVVTQMEERFESVAWIPIVQFEPTVASCAEQTEAALSQNKLNFVTGSAQLDARSFRAINVVGSIVRQCVVSGRLKAEIQGHTDAQGSDAANQALSQSRANAVAVALMDRGVPQDGLTAVGYGESQPIADNGSAEGRAKNRRTTIVWSE